MTQPDTTTGNPAMAVHHAVADTLTSTKETAAVDKLASRLPHGPTAAMLDLVRIAAYTLGNHAARRWCQQLVRDNKPPPRQPNALDDQVDADGIRLEGMVHVALTELWGDCDALLRAMHGMRAAIAEPVPGRALVPADAATVRLDRVPPADARRRVRGLQDGAP